MKAAIVLTTIVFLVISAELLPIYSQTAMPSPLNRKLLEKDRELVQLYVNIYSRYQNFFSSQMWTLTHAYEDKEEVDRVLNYFTEFFEIVQANDERKYEEMGGVKGFKDKFVEFLRSKDQAVRAFSAAILGMAGDKRYSPEIVKLVNERDRSFDSEHEASTTFYRGRACVALGILGAIEYKADIAKLLRSKNSYDRSGAILGLGYLNAVEYTDEIVGILTKYKHSFGGDDSPLHFLIDTKQAAKYKREIVSTMLGSDSSEIVQAAAYSLAAIGAKEHSKDVARLLRKEFVKGTAAKVLAFLGAKQYESQIALLLKDSSSLVRADALTALGILGARRYSAKISGAINDNKDNFAAVNAAEAILLIGEKRYFPKALKALNLKSKHRPYSLAGNFHPFVADKVDDLRKRLESVLDSLDR